MKRKTQIDRLIKYLKGGYRSNFQIQQHLRSSSGDRRLRALRQDMIPVITELGVTKYLYVEGIDHYELRIKKCSDVIDGGKRSYNRWKLVKVY